MISDPSPTTKTLPSPIAPKEGIGLLDRLSLIEWAVQSAIIGDNGPLTSSPNQRRNMSLVFADVAGQLLALAKRFDPLSEPVQPGKVAPFTPAKLPEGAFRLPEGAWEEALARVDPVS